MKNNRHDDDDSTAPDEQSSESETAESSLPAVKRRSFLKNVAAGTVASAFFPGAVDAESESSSFSDDFNYATDQLQENGWTIENGDFGTQNSNLVCGFPDDLTIGSNIHRPQTVGTGEFSVENIENSGYDSMEVAFISDATRVVDANGYAIKFEGQQSGSEATPKASLVRLDTGEETELLRLTDDHGTEPHSVRVVRDEESHDFTVYFDETEIGTVSDEAYKQSTYWTIRYSYERGSQTIDGVGASPTTTLSLYDPRLVQAVEDTDVTDVGSTDYDYAEPDPTLVAKRFTAPLFELNATGISQLPSTVDVEVTRKIRKSSGTGTKTETDTFEIPKSDIRSIQNGTDPRVVFHENANSSGTSDDIPVFPVDLGGEELLEVTVTIAPNQSSIGDSFTLRRGTDFSILNCQPLRIGFVDVRDPEGGTNYGDPADGETQEYEETVEAAAERFAQYFPTCDVRIYRHDTPIQGATDSNGDTIQGDRAEEIDTREARCLLDDQLPVETSESGIGTRLDRFEGRIEEFDATVLIVPAEDGFNDHYYEFHGSRTTLGFHPANLKNPTKSQPQRSTNSVEGGGRVTAEEAGNTVAQEVGHHLELRPYEGPTFSSKQDHPLAKRPDWQSRYGVHAAPQFDDLPEVTSVGFDLRDGSFELGNGVASSGDEPVEGRPFMSYELDEPIWTDSRMFEETLQDRFSPTPKEAENPQEPFIFGFHCTVLFDPETGEVTQTSCSNCLNGIYAPPIIPDGDVSLSVRNGDDEEVASVQTSSGIAYVGDGGEHTEVENLLPLSIPFPEDAVALELTIDGTTTRLEPISNLLRSAVVKLPEQAFVRNPEQRRRALRKMIDAVERKMEQGAFTGAAATLRNNIRPTIERWIAEEYDTAANVLTKDELLELVDDLLRRVESATD
jgi:hypothetical protein